jgi:bifunctional non-homologous end joining protein LigD
VARAKPGERIDVAGISVSHPTRVLEPPGVTKLALARYYEAVASRMLPHALGRPLTLLRWAEGPPTEKGGIYLRHAKAWGPTPLHRVTIREKTKTGEYLVIVDAKGLVSLAQMDILEIHTWNAIADDVERPDRVVFDLDPAPDVPWNETASAALEIRDRLAKLGLASWVKTTGGKGLHVVVPLTRGAGWDTCFEFTRRFAQQMVADTPKRYIATMSKAARKGLLFVDYLRNNRASTSVSAFSTRSRPGPPVSMPVDWSGLATLDPAAFTMKAVAELVSGRWADPWKGYWKAKQTLPE